MAVAAALAEHLESEAERIRAGELTRVGSPKALYDPGGEMGPPFGGA